MQKFSQNRIEEVVFADSIKINWTSFVNFEIQTKSFECHRPKAVLIPEKLGFLKFCVTKMFQLVFNGIYCHNSQNLIFSHIYRVREGSERRRHTKSRFFGDHQNARLITKSKHSAPNFKKPESCITSIDKKDSLFFERSLMTPHGMDHSLLKTACFWGHQKIDLTPYQS